MYNENGCSRTLNLSRILADFPDASAVIRGSDRYKEINGTVKFYGTDRGVLVVTQVMGLPLPQSNCLNPVFGFHIHGGSQCSGNSEDAFANVGSHFNPAECNHPFHAGDMPPLFGNKGLAVSVFLTDRFSVENIIGKTVIIHRGADDFTTQPAGNAGVKMACGEIKKCTM